MWTGILWAAAVCAGLGLLGSVVLVLASRFLAVPQDERVGRLQEALPGANCGACGYAGCADYAKAIAEGAPVNKCVPGGEAVAKAAAAIMGVEAGSVLKRTAYVAAELFLALNSLVLMADDMSATLTMLQLAAGDMDEDAYAAWLRQHLQAL